MKNRVWIVAGLIAATAMAQDGVTIRRALTEGSETTYAMSLDNSTNAELPTGAQEFKSKTSSTLIFKLGKVEGESAEVTLTTKDMKTEMDMGGMQPPGDAPKPPSEMVTKGKVDHRNRLSDLKLETKLDGNAAMMARMTQNAANWATVFFEFPEGPIKQGASWEVKVPANSELGVGEAIYNVKFDGETDGILRFSFTGKVPLNADSSKMSGADQMPFQFVMTGTNNSTGTAAYVKATGELMNYTSTSEGTASMDVMGTAIPMKSHTTIKLSKK